MSSARSPKTGRHGLSDTLRARITFRIEKYSLFGVGGLFMLVGFCLYVAGALDLLRATVLWLRTGAWEAVGTAVVVGRLPRQSNLLLWLESPSDWIGLHTVIEVIFLRWPWFAVSLIYGMASFVCGMVLFLRVHDLERAWIQRNS